jgi:hypothetical protein
MQFLTGSSEGDAEIKAITPYRWDGECNRCGNGETVTASTDEEPDAEVCDSCKRGVIVWRSVQW